MEVSYRWLADFLDLEVSYEAVEEYAERLTQAGAEVENVKRIGTPSRLIVGKVTDLEPHPDADNLFLAEIKDGQSKVPTITGADNLEVGALVPLIKAPGKLPDGTKIESQSFRGEESRGMLCSKEELGLEEKSQGIWTLGGLGFSVGEELNHELEFDDYVLSFEITSNRPDLLSVIGIARELSVLTGKELSPPKPTFASEAPAPVEIEIEDSEDTPRYTARTLSDVKVGPSPLRIQHRLAKVGLRPKNNVVDATNYAMIELGHPLHPFDLDRINGEAIRIRRAETGERLTTLDGEQRELGPENLVIADKDNPVALAGIMGGQTSEVTSFSKNILLEGACFDQAQIRKSAQFLGTTTDASRRFEKGMDPGATVRAINRVTEILGKQRGFKSASKLADSYPSPSEPETITLRRERANSIIGVEIGENEIERILSGLGCGVDESSDEGFSVKPPSVRVDLTRGIDLIEELARIHGYDRVPETPPDSGEVNLFRTREEKATEKAKKVFTGLGLYEVISPGFATDKELDEEKSGVRLKNPMGEKRSELRPDVVSSLVRHAENNFKEESDSIALFEIGNVFQPGKDEPIESTGLGIFLAGRRYEGIDGKENYSFWDLKGILEDFFDALMIDASFEPGGPKFLHPGRKAEVSLAGESVGYAGELHPDRAEEYDLQDRVYLSELNFETLTEEISFEGSYERLPQFPASKRDLSITVPQDVTEKEIRATITNQARVESVYLYDLYQGEQIDSDRRSLTYEITFRDKEKTLSDEEVDEIVRDIRKELEDKSIALRE